MEGLRDLARRLRLCQIDVREVDRDLERLAEVAHIRAFADALLLDVDVLRADPGGRPLLQSCERLPDLAQLIAARRRVERLVHGGDEVALHVGHHRAERAQRPGRERHEHLLDADFARQHEAVGRAGAAVGE